MIVAIDGPAGSGKSTIAKEIARQLGFNKLDTGARRRVLQRHQNDAQPLTSEQLEAEVDETLDALKQRDKLDSSREVAPLVPAEDAVHVDSTAHTIDEVVHIIEDLINQRR